MCYCYSLLLVETHFVSPRNLLVLLLGLLDGGGQLLDLLVVVC